MPGGAASANASSRMISSGEEPSTGGRSASRIGSAACEQAAPFPRMLGAGNKSRLPVQDGIGAISQQSTLGRRRCADLLPLHGFDRVSPECHHVPNLHYSSSQRNRTSPPLLRKV